jgi:hypothetical protein
LTLKKQVIKKRRIPMGLNDGQVLGTTRILNNGSNARRYNIVLLAEGYTAGQQTDFNDKCQEFLQVMNEDPWFRHLTRGINIHRINVESDEAGLDDPEDCESGTGIFRDTFFDASTCTGWPTPIRRLTRCDNWLVTSICDQEVPEWDIAIVLINTDLGEDDPLNGIRGGSGGGRIGTATTGSGDWAHVVLHEIGHTAFGLADEYHYYASSSCESPEEGQSNPWPGFELSEPNVTRAVHGLFFEPASNRSHIKWGHLVNPATNIPTVRNFNCDTCPPETSPLSSDYEIGLFEGARYFRCDFFRPAARCRMRNSSLNFCFVCVEAIHDTLRTFLPAGSHVVSEIDTLDFGPLCSGQSSTLTFKIANLGAVYGDVGVRCDNPSIDVSWGTFGVKPGLLFNPLGLIPGQMAEVSAFLQPITLNPGESQRVIGANLQIEVDGNVVSQIPISATICAPNTQIGIVPDDLNLGFGSVAVGLTMYRGIRIENTATCCPVDLHVTVDDPAGVFVLAPDTEKDITLAPGASTFVYIAFTAPNQPGIEFTGYIDLHTNVPASPTLTVNLRAGAVAPVPVDSVLVFDRSGSMIGATGETGARKIDHAIYAADLYISLLRPNDRIALVRFNQNANQAQGDLLLDLVEAGAEVDGAGRAAARSKLIVDPDHLQPNGTTSIGRGIVLGSTVLDGATSNQRAMLVLTDGIENTGTTIESARDTVNAKTPAQRVFAVGLGLNQLSRSIRDIANVNRGVAFVTGDLVGDKEFLLQKLFAQILSDVGNDAFVRDPKYILNKQEKIAVDVFIGEVDLTADFVVVTRPGSFKYGRAWLEAPNGNLLYPQDIGNYPGSQYLARDTSLLFRLTFPIFAADLTGHVGRWRVWLENTATTGGTSGDAPFVCAVIVRAYSNLRFHGWVEQEAYTPGSEVRFTFQPSLYGLPAPAMAPAQARVIFPDGSSELVTLSSDEEYRYSGSIPNTEQFGLYGIDCQLGILTPSGLPVTRSRYMTAFILPPGKDKPPDEKKPERGFVIIVMILIFIRGIFKWLNSLFSDRS